LPVLVPGAAVSPGISTWSFESAAVLTVILALVFAVLAPSVASVAVIVAVPEVFNVTEKVVVPETKLPFAGRSAFESVEVIAIESVAELIRFQFASTAFTVTENAVPAVCAEGLPVFPVELPAEAVSPGTSNCNLVNEPALTVMLGLVLAVFVPSVASVAVTVAVPAVFAVTLKVLVPATRVAFAGKVAFASLEVIAIEWVEVVTFQLASTALTVTVNALPEV
jgi:hypothetical protein